MVLDLHLGKVDPKILHKDFDPGREKHDPGEYLWKNVVGAQSVKDALAPIEPPYPRYQRTLVALQKYMQMAKEEVPDPLPQVKKPSQQASIRRNRKTCAQAAVSGRPAFRSRCPEIHSNIRAPWWRA